MENENNAFIVQNHFLIDYLCFTIFLVVVKISGGAHVDRHPWAIACPLPVKLTAPPATVESHFTV
jgi:hypothetical protein